MTPIKDRFAPEDCAGMLAREGGVAGTEPRSLPDAKPTSAATAEDTALASPVRKRFSTSLDFPDYVDEQITTWLRGSP